MGEVLDRLGTRAVIREPYRDLLNPEQTEKYEVRVHDDEGWVVEWSTYSSSGGEPRVGSAILVCNYLVYDINGSEWQNTCGVGSRSILVRRSDHADIAVISFTIDDIDAQLTRLREVPGGFQTEWVDATSLRLVRPDEQRSMARRKVGDGDPANGRIAAMPAGIRGADRELLTVPLNFLSAIGK